jgi:hypothetical protein
MGGIPDGQLIVVGDSGIFNVELGASVREE